MENLDILDVNDATEIEDLKYESTIKYMKEFLEMSRDRKIVVLKSYLFKYDGLTLVGINRLLKNINSHFTLSIARYNKDLENLKNSRIGLNHNSSRIRRNK